MKHEDFKRIQDEIEQKKKQNEREYYENDEKYRMSKVNQIDYQSSLVLVFGLLTYLLICLISLPTGLFTKIPIAISMLSLFGISTAIGILGKDLIMKRGKAKKRYHDFATSDKEFDKYENEILYQIELEKNKVRDINYNKLLDLLKSNESILDNVRSKYNIESKNSQLTKEELLSIIKDLEEMLKEKERELDELVTKRVINERLYHARNKAMSWMDNIMRGMLGGTTSMIISSLPLFMLGNLHLTPVSILAIIFSTFSVGFVGVATYMFKKNNRSKSIFKSLNDRLKDKMDEKVDDSIEERKTLDAMIESKSQDINNTMMRIEENKSTLLGISNSDREEKEELASEISLQQVQDRAKTLSLRY